MSASIIIHRKILTIVWLFPVATMAAKGCVDPMNYWNVLLDELSPTKTLQNHEFDLEAHTNCINAAERVMRIARNVIYQSQDAISKCTYPPVDWAYHTQFDPEYIDYTDNQWEFQFNNDKNNSLTPFDRGILWDIKRKTDKMVNRIQRTLDELVTREGSYMFLDFHLPNSENGVHHRWVIEAFHQQGQDGGRDIQARMYQSFFGHFSLQKWLEPWVNGRSRRRRFDGWSNRSNPILAQTGFDGSNDGVWDAMQRNILGQHSWRDDSITTPRHVYHFNETQLRQHMDVLFLYLYSAMQKWMEDMILFHAFPPPTQMDGPQQCLNQNHDQRINLTQCIEEHMTYYHSEDKRLALLENPHLLGTMTRKKQDFFRHWKDYLDHLHQVEWNHNTLDSGGEVNWSSYRQRFVDCKRRSEWDTPPALLGNSRIDNKRLEMMYTTMFLFGPIALCTKLPFTGMDQRHVFHFRVINTTLCDHYQRTKAQLKYD